VKPRLITWTVLALLCLGLTYGCYLVLSPFFSEIFLALVLGIVFHPAYAWVLRRTGRPSLAAWICTLATGLLFLLPVTVLGMVITQEVKDVVESLNRAIGPSGGLEWLERGLAFVSDKLGWNVEQTKEFLQTRLGGVGSSLISNALKSLQGLGGWLFSSVITLVTLFFLFREGADLVRESKNWVPLPPQVMDDLFEETRKLMFANVYGVLAVAFAQGTLTGLGFWFSGVPSPVLWGSVAGLLSILPFIGAGLVWIPAVIYLFATGATTTAVVLLVYSLVITSNADNVIRPIVLSESAQMNTAVMFFALLGGIQAFGLVGLFAGPLVFSLAIAVAKLLREYGSAVKLVETEVTES
jgi:predicted PurR-regulated permease PerM